MLRTECYQELGYKARGSSRSSSLVIEASQADDKLLSLRVI